MAGASGCPSSPNRLLWRQPAGCCEGEGRSPCAGPKKDFIIDERQIGETRALGADAVLLIAAVRGSAFRNLLMLHMKKGLNHWSKSTTQEVKSALATRANLIGINNRDLSTLAIDRSTTRLLSEQVRVRGKTIVSESGMRSADDVREMKLYCDAFLIGSSIMADAEPKKKLEEFVCA